MNFRCIASLSGQCQKQPYACQSACAMHCETLVRYCMPYCLDGETPADALARLSAVVAAQQSARGIDSGEAGETRSGSTPQGQEPGPKDAPNTNEDTKEGATPAAAAPPERFQGGLTNEELREAWNRKLPGVEPTDRELTAFALGVEVGDGPCQVYFRERNSARDAWASRVKRCEELEAALAARPVDPAPASAVPAGWLEALRFYANGDHMMLGNEGAWESASGEAENWLCDEAGTAAIEDGSFALMALRGQPIPWVDSDGDTTPAPVAGEIAPSAPVAPGVAQDAARYRRLRGNYLRIMVCDATGGVAFDLACEDIELNSDEDGARLDAAVDALLSSPVEPTKKEPQ